MDNHIYNYHHDNSKVVYLWNICLIQIEDFQRLVDDEHLVLPTDKPVWIGVRHSEEAGYRYWWLPRLSWLEKKLFLPGSNTTRCMQVLWSSWRERGRRECNVRDISETKYTHTILWGNIGRPNFWIILGYLQPSFLHQRLSSHNSASVLQHHPSRGEYDVLWSFFFASLSCLLQHHLLNFPSFCHLCLIFFVSQNVDIRFIVWIH